MLHPWHAPARARPPRPRPLRPPAPKPPPRAWPCPPSPRPAGPRARSPPPRRGAGRHCWARHPARPPRPPPSLPAADGAGAGGRGRGPDRAAGREARAWRRARGAGRDGRRVPALRRAGAGPRARGRAAAAHQLLLPPLPQLHPRRAGRAVGHGAGARARGPGVRGRAGRPPGPPPLPGAGVQVPQQRGGRGTPPAACPRHSEAPPTAIISGVYNTTLRPEPAACVRPTVSRRMLTSFTAGTQVVYPALDLKVKNVTLAYTVEHEDEVRTGGLHKP